MSGALLLLLALPVCAENKLAEKVEREVAQPVLKEVEAAARGETTGWQPAGPANPAAKRLADFLGTIVDPLASHAQREAAGAARRLASPDAEYQDASMPALDLGTIIGRWMTSELKPEPAPDGSSAKPLRVAAPAPKRADTTDLVRENLAPPPRKRQGGPIARPVKPSN